MRKEKQDLFHFIRVLWPALAVWTLEDIFSLIILILVPPPARCCCCGCCSWWCCCLLSFLRLYCPLMCDHFLLRSHCHILPLLLLLLVALNSMRRNTPWTVYENTINLAKCIRFISFYFPVWERDGERWYAREYLHPTRTILAGILVVRSSYFIRQKQQWYTWSIHLHRIQIYLCVILRLSRAYSVALLWQTGNYLWVR